MAGHNKWSKVKNFKGALDAKRGKLFTKLGKEITVAARLGGGNPDANARLRQAISAAREVSMPKENIERALKKGTGELESAAVEEITYEGYGPGGAAIIVEATTDNKNRTVSDLRNLFKSHGGNLGEAGSVAWMFSHFGQLLFEKSKYEEDTLTEIALEVGAQDIITSGEFIEVLTSPTDIYRIKDSFDRVGHHPTSSGFTYSAKNQTPVTGAAAEQLVELLEAIDDHDDVQRVHTNLEIN